MKKTPFDNQLLSVLIKNQKEKFKWIVIVYHITIRIVKKISKLNYFNIYIILKSKVVIVKFTIDKILKVKIITFKWLHKQINIENYGQSGIIIMKMW